MGFNNQFGEWGSYVITSGDAVSIAKKACLAGARIIQYRDKTASRKQMLETARRLRDITTDHNVMLIVNDFIDVAMLVSADGIHLGQDDIPISEARNITPEGLIIGISTHSIDQAKEAEAAGADYIGIGPVFATPTKQGNVPIGMDIVREVVSIMHIPVVAIGGINPDNVNQLKGAGVTNVAMVRGFTSDTENVVRKINNMFLGL